MSVHHSIDNTALSTSVKKDNTALQQRSRTTLEKCGQGFHSRSFITVFILLQVFNSFLPSFYSSNP
ncbi:hypothetical protein HanIR_Chr15g0740061 [Helianthus annuus]|nr:hypothetical protein HanIR_Chr15g0740061 [Helianthus annuus]